MTAPELKPCPFCGGEAITSSSVVDRRTLYAHCKDHTCPGWSVSRCLPVRWNHRADLAAVPAQVRVNPLVALVEELTTAVWHLLDNSETSGPIDDPTITVWQPDFDTVSSLLDRIEGLSSGSTDDMTAGELLSASILAAIEPQPDPRDEVIARLVEALEMMRSTYPYNPPCYGWREQVEAHKAAKSALAAAKEMQSD